MQRLIFAKNLMIFYLIYFNRMKNVLYNVETHDIDIDIISFDNVRTLRNGFFVNFVIVEIQLEKILF